MGLRLQILRIRQTHWTRAHCAHALHETPALQRLQAVDLPLSLEAVAALAAATQLTALHLEHCGLSPGSVVGVLRTSLTQLQCLQAAVGPSMHVVYSGDLAVWPPAAVCFRGPASRRVDCNKCCAALLTD